MRVLTRPGPTSTDVGELTTPRVCLLAVAAAVATSTSYLRAARVANQSTVLGIDPARPAQFNGACMVVYFIGGTLGTAVGGLIDLADWAGIGFTATTAVTVAASILLSSGRAFAADRERRPQRIDQQR